MTARYIGNVQNDNDELVEFDLTVSITGGSPTPEAEEALMQALADYGSATISSASYFSFKKHVDTVTDVTPSP
jgi:predicted ThiF/HesA family dinucleotide-utilizing enzyme